MNGNKFIYVNDAVKFLRVSEKAIQEVNSGFDVSKDISEMEAAISWMQKLPPADVLDAKPKYIRIGEIPKDEKSGIYDKRRGTYAKSEAGVSVYDAAFIRGKWHIVVPNPCTETTVDTMHGKLLEQCGENFDHAEVYLVDGELVGFGSDGEPLLKNVNIIENLGKEHFSYIDNAQKEG